MTYNVFSGTLNPTHSHSGSSSNVSFCTVFCKMSSIIHRSTLGPNLKCKLKFPCIVSTYTFTASVKTRAKDVLPNSNRTQAAKVAPSQQQWNGPVCCCMTIFAASAFHSIAAGGDGSAQHIFCSWWPWGAVVMLDIQTRPSEGPNVFLVNLAQIIQRFPRYFLHKQKSHRQRQKQSLTQFIACGKYAHWGLLHSICAAVDSRSLIALLLQSRPLRDHSILSRNGPVYQSPVIVMPVLATVVCEMGADSKLHVSPLIYLDC